ncbi:hypothetical protein EDB85DRAFT_751518 [Lactarius pseudohatsudake]|nr:hypothetical protein EDB85DRAFT_751518 [Lactarius pseudohatsudake]
MTLYVVPALPILLLQSARVQDPRCGPTHSIQISYPLSPVFRVISQALRPPGFGSPDAFEQPFRTARQRQRREQTDERWHECCLWLRTRTQLPLS